MASSSDEIVNRGQFVRDNFRAVPFSPNMGNLSLTEVCKTVCGRVGVGAQFFTRLVIRAIFRQRHRLVKQAFLNQIRLMVLMGVNRVWSRGIAFCRCGTAFGTSRFRTSAALEFPCAGRKLGAETVVASICSIAPSKSPDSAKCVP